MCPDTFEIVIACIVTAAFHQLFLRVGFYRRMWDTAKKLFR